MQPIHSVLVLFLVQIRVFFLNYQTYSFVHGLSFVC